MNERNQDGYLDRCHADDFISRVMFEQALQTSRDWTCAHCSRDMREKPYERCSNGGLIAQSLVYFIREENFFQ